MRKIFAILAALLTGGIAVALTVGPQAAEAALSQNLPSAFYFSNKALPHKTWSEVEFKGTSD